MQSVPVDKKSTPGDPDPPRSGSATIAKRAVIGAMWTIATSLGSRIFGLAGSLIITRFLDPEICGTFSLASVVVLTAFVLSTCGLSQYIVSKPNEGREAVFHATFYFMLLGVVALGVVVLLRGWIALRIHAPGIEDYIPGLALAAVFERIAMVQDRILVRDMRFQSVGLQRSLGEIVYATSSVALAWAGFGGRALIWASIARSGVRLVTLSITTPRREWLEPCRITWKRTRDLFAFGLPMSLASLAGFGSRYWDNVVIGGHFGEHTAGIYNYAYNLADIPATQIGETIGDVLVPSFAKMESDERRKKAFLASMRMLLLIVAPLAVGLGVISRTLVHTFFKPPWWGIASMLSVLSVLSVVRPMGWIGSSYLQVKNKPRAIMLLEVTKTAGLLALMYLFENLWHILDHVGMHGVTETLGLERHAALWACGAVGVAFAITSFGYAYVIKKLEGISLRTQILPLLPPVIACAPMVLAVLGIRHVLGDMTLPKGAQFIAELLGGALVFVPSALLLAPSTSRELLNLLKNALMRRRQRGLSMRPPPPDDVERLSLRPPPPPELPEERASKPPIV